MKIFFVTDNKTWFNFLMDWRKQRAEVISLYCSPAGSKIFNNEIASGLISVVDLSLHSADVAKDFDLGFSCHCKQIFPENLVNSIPCFNFHPGFNPENRGWFPQVFSIINGKPAGATLHKMDIEIDNGPIIERIEVAINSWDTSKSVYSRVMNEEFQLFEKWIDRIIAGNYQEIFLDSSGNYNSISDFKQLCEIDLEKKVTFKEAIGYLRAMTFDGYDNAFFRGDGGQKIYVSINLKVGE